ncbi:uncharacterized protein N7506_003891 [Penicillium brevicompactum]|uniref:uncharacterized protein n=1 Tax=Penicillium brevicompactum TaxID=5074 RepID=UPI0025413ABF|nr:uncharacterized protein N7506_003891 [Penicillium brevicompactum]KAJ5344067.1 hypothetical protein N7506_003891 [Penicillium brevicompactum]
MPSSPYNESSKSSVSCLLRKLYKSWESQKKNVDKLRKKFERAEERYNLSVLDLRNEKGRQRNRLIRENLERYKNEQPVIDSERQLSGKVFYNKVNTSLCLETDMQFKQE